MNIEFSKAFLMSGKDFKINELISLHHPTVGEILSLNDSIAPDHVYWMYINIILSDPYSNMVMLDDLGKNYLEVSPYEVFLLQWDNCIENYNENKEFYDANHFHPLNNIIDALNLFLEGAHILTKGHYEDGDICFYDVENKSFQINKDVYECIYEWVKTINKIDYSGRINPADENARRVLIEDMRDEIKKAKRRKKKKKDDNSDYFGNIMSSNCFCGNGTINVFNINDCKIYWLNEAMSIVNKKNNADHLLDGIYHGTISSKDINKKELDWVNN